MGDDDAGVNTLTARNHSLWVEANLNTCAQWEERIRLWVGVFTQFYTGSASIKVDCPFYHLCILNST